MKIKIIGFALGAILVPVGSMAALPNGFQDQKVVGGLNQPSSLDFLPDGRVLVVEQTTGNLRLVVDTTLVVGPLLTIPDLNTVGNERGLLGVAVDFFWPTRPYVYVYFTRTPGNVAYLSRFTAAGDLSDGASTNLSLGNRFDILTDIPDNAGNHNAGTLRFGPDCKLYVSLGDDGNACAAQDSSDLRGVILRLDISALPDTGTGPPAKALITPGDNPFPATDPNAGLTFCYGLRNPFRFHIDPLTAKVYIGDVGQRDHEEVNEAVGGENFGWPFREGPLVRTQGGCSEPGGSGASVYDGPIGGYDRSALNSAAIIAGPRYRPQPGGLYNFPSTYDGAVFFAEYYGGFLRVLHETGGGWAPLDSVPGQPNALDWGTGTPGVGDFREGPDGAIYYLSQFSGELRRIVYSSTVTAAPDSPAPPSPVLAVRPNPYHPGNGVLTIDLATGAGPGSAVQIFDATGKRVRFFSVRDSRETPLSWDGRDDGGRLVPAGMYFIAKGYGKDRSAGRVIVIH